ncbi:hypothetical protein D3C80_2056250 [compost metagenome]
MWLTLRNRGASPLLPVSTYAFLRQVIAAQGAQLLQRIGTGLRRLGTLDQEMLEVEVLMLIARVEVMRGQYHREHRYLGFQLNLHQAADH